LITSKLKFFFVFGTRPEAIKLAPVILELRNSKDVEIRICITGQQREMLDQVLRIFDIVADYDLEIMRPNQSLTQVTASVLQGLEPLIKKESPDLIIVHGDTSTTLAASIAAYYQKKPVAHVEAGLRTGNIYSPWPEEINRRLTGSLAKYHFAPTEISKNNLIKEGIPATNIHVTGNTVIDALLMVVKKLKNNTNLTKNLDLQFSFLNSTKKIILVTGHRRENFREGFEKICAALSQLAIRDDIQIVYPVHLNPNVKDPVHKILGNNINIHLIEPLDYIPFVYLMQKSYLVLTDSGGIQEEAPSLGKPVLVMRNTTERPEAIEVGTVKLVGTDTHQIVSQVNNLLDNQSRYSAMSIAHNPYGDGKAAQRICKKLLTELK
jgi:UDP-N-acetylglucosamine 2-epimerase (non-hydrolysing)